MPGLRVIAVIAALSWAAVSFAQPVHDCDIRSLDLSGGDLSEMVFDGRYAFVANPAGVEVVDTIAPGGAARVASIPILGSRLLHLRGDVLFVAGLQLPAAAAPGVELHILDVSDPQEPAPISRLVLDYFFAPNSMDVEGDLLLLGLPTRADCIDISDLSAPVRVGTFDTLPLYATIREVELIGATAAIFLPYTAQMLSVSVADPTTPVLIGEVALPGVHYNPIPIDTASEGDLLLAAMRDFVYAISMADPASPQLLSVVEVDAWDLALESNHAFVLSRDLTILDYTDPANPQTLLTCCTADLYHANSQIAVNAGRGFLAEIKAMRTIDFSEVAAPVEGPSAPRFNGPTAIAVDGDDALVSQWSSAAYMIPMSHAAPLAPIGAVPFSDGAGHGPAEKIAFQGTRAIIARGAFANVHNRLYAIDAADRAAPFAASMREFAGVVGGVRLQGEVALACTSAAGVEPPTLWSLDAADPTAGLPTISALQTPALVNFEIDGHALHAIGADGSLYTFNIADPAAMVLASTLPGVLPAGAEPIDIEIANGRAYILDRASRLATLDLAAPFSPQPLALVQLIQIAGNIYATDIEVTGDTLYLTASRGFEPRLMAFDIADPSAPVPLASRLIPPFVDYPLALTPTGVLVGAGVLLHFDFATCPCPADLNFDGQVDMADLMLAIDAFNTTPNDPNYNPAADANGDNAVDFADLNLVLSAFNTPC